MAWRTVVRRRRVRASGVPKPSLDQLRRAAAAAKRALRELERQLARRKRPARPRARSERLDPAEVYGSLGWTRRNPRFR